MKDKHEITVRLPPHLYSVATLPNITRWKDWSEWLCHWMAKNCRMQRFIDCSINKTDIVSNELPESRNNGEYVEQDNTAWVTAFIKL